MKSTLLLSLVPFIQGVLGAADVTGGSPATIDKVPYLVSVLQWNKYACAGVLIGSNFVVTAAQCVDGVESVESFNVRTGSNSTSWGGSVLEITKILRHGQFNPTTYDFDLALLKFTPPVTFSPTVIPAPLVPSGQEPANGTECVASGWGGSGGELQSVTLPIVDHDVCNQTYGGQITDHMICAGGKAGKGTCPGDRGGPLVCGGKLAGIISQTNGCDLLGLPDVFTDLADAGIQNWILATVMNN
ncbi:trypsin-like serine protease [Aspergillus violaceofuscus CBS 115571]|uniref:Trypsin-like serine protease n=1 Tax=Aspergillus violaceofuscus (strain CBS 115571) TaxID=1450538 RepID=A0A2V5GYN3_ASPV1|nr:trypsin-like serine protease [Aspergillus violaceofuscus CBS 115571]